MRAYLKVFGVITSLLAAYIALVPVAA